MSLVWGWSSYTNEVPKMKFRMVLAYSSLTQNLNANVSNTNEYALWTRLWVAEIRTTSYYYVPPAMISSAHEFAYETRISLPVWSVSTTLRFGVLFSVGLETVHSLIFICRRCSKCRYVGLFNWFHFGFAKVGIRKLQWETDHGWQTV